jgi:DNA-binding GntR family transcriptional regulator
MDGPGSPTTGAPSTTLYMKSLREQVYEFLREELYSGRILPNHTLNLKKISSRLGVSVTPLRDALIRMESEGFVTIQPRKGVVVNSLSLQDVKNYYQIIGALEGEVIKSVFRRLNKVHIATMKRLNDQMREALQNDGFDSYYQLNIAFHDIFIKLSDNKALRPLIMPLKQRLYDFQRRPYVKAWEFRNCSEHDQFIGFIEREDQDAALHILRDVHWSFNVQEEYIREFYRIGLER